MEVMRRSRTDRMLDHIYVDHLYGRGVTMVSDCQDRTIKIGDIPATTAPTISDVERIHRRVLQIPVKIVHDRELNREIMYAHRKTHKRIKKYLSLWKSISASVVLKHAPWKELKGK